MVPAMVMLEQFVKNSDGLATCTVCLQPEGGVRSKVCEIVQTVTCYAITKPKGFDMIFFGLVWVILAAAKSAFITYNHFIY